MAVGCSSHLHCIVHGDPILPSWYFLILLYCLWNWDALLRKLFTAYFVRWFCYSWWKGNIRISRRNYMLTQLKFSAAQSGAPSLISFSSLMIIPCNLLVLDLMLDLADLPDSNMQQHPACGLDPVWDKSDPSFGSDFRSKSCFSWH